MSPFRLPANARTPPGAKTRELGGFGRKKLEPRVLVAPVICVMNAPQLKNGGLSGGSHCVLVTHALGTAGVVGRVTWTLITCLG